MTEGEISGNQCVFCSIIEGKIGSAKIYEDDIVVCVLDIFPASKGHMLVIPKKHFSISAQMDTKTNAHVFEVANKMSGMLFNIFGSKGTNIVVSNGETAGQKVNHVCVNVIPRYEGDGVNISWRNEQIKEEELKDVFGKISREIKGQEIPEEPKAVVDTTKVVSDGLAIENTNEATSGEFDDEVLP